MVDNRPLLDLLRLAAGDLPPNKRMLLAKAFSRFQEEDDLIAGLCVWLLTIAVLWAAAMLTMPQAAGFQTAATPSVPLPPICVVP